MDLGPRRRHGRQPCGSKCLFGQRRAPDPSRVRKKVSHERKENAVAFLERAIAWLASLGVTVERVMTDNGSAYRSRAFAQACQAAGLKHKRTRPYTPRTNGKAERFIQTSLREWAYLQAFSSSAARTEAMRPWLHGYNRLRPHSALGGKPPFTRLAKDNLHSNDS